MATLIPTLHSCLARMTSGERRLAQRLEEKLEEDYLLWYDVPVGPRRLHPDFIVLHPLRGLIVLEVKDWSLENIRQVNPDTFTVWISGVEKRYKNPLEQARSYTLAIVGQLQQDPQLVEPAGPHQGKLAFPYSYGVVFPNIRRRALDQAYGQEPLLAEVLPPNRVICQDEMVPTVDPLAFQECLWNFCTYEFGEPLTTAQVDRIRWHLFSDLRLEVYGDEADNEQALDLPDVIRIMDLQQEQLARSLGEGHRVIHGVAGSGKTMILAYRCLHLAQETTKPILVLCYNVCLASMLRHKLYAEGVGHRVTIRSIHKWCKDLLWQYRIPQPSTHQFSGEAYGDEIIRRVAAAVQSGQIAAGQYGAILIDEGHDFKPEWYQLVVQMLDPETESLLVLYDDAQSIYDKQRRQQFSFKSVGINAQGRTKILKVNYRNTEEILALAYGFAREFLTPTDTADDDTPMQVQPETAGRHGPKPMLVKLPSFRQEVDYLARQVKALQAQGMAWKDIGILYRIKFMAEAICRRFETEDIPIAWLNQDRESRNFNPQLNSIKLVTLHSSKGLEFPVVCIPGLGFLPHRNADPTDEARLLYVAMTRATHQMLLTCDRTSSFVQRLETVLATVA